ncbi:MAG: DEAD/DEAH box helicase [Marinifilaceae bacterium]|jgi:SNF2 family DNA or RNA helicase|nr:DEAD/DEAH box helicase [Marinifilaceae bacterium]
MFNISKKTWQETFSEDEKLLLLNYAFYHDLSKTSFAQMLAMNSIVKSDNSKFKTTDINLFFKKLESHQYLTKYYTNRYRLNYGILTEVLIYFYTNNQDYYEKIFQLKSDDGLHYYNNEYFLVCFDHLLRSESFDFDDTIEEFLAYNDFSEVISLFYQAFYHGENIMILDKTNIFIAEKCIDLLINIAHMKFGDMKKIIEYLKHNTEIDIKPYRNKLNQHLFFSNKLNELIDKDNIENQALISFAKSDYDKSYLQFKEFQTIYNADSKSRRKYIPSVYGFCFILNMFRSEKDPKILKTYINNYIKEEGKFFEPLKLLFEAKYEAAENKSIRTLNSIILDTDNFLALIVLFWIDKEEFKTGIANQVHHLSNTNRNNLELFHNCLMDMRKSIERKNHKFENDNFSFADILRIDKEWEKDLNLLESLSDNNNNTKHTAPSKSRLVWMINFKQELIEGLEQKLNKSGKWSKGKKVSLKRIKEQQLDFMTGQDILISNSIHRYRGYYGSEYEIDVPSAIRNMVNHPFLYLIDSPSTNIEISLQKPELLIKKTKKEYTISFEKNTKKAFKSDLNTIKESLTNYVYYDFSDKLINFFDKLLSQTLTFPLESKNRFENAIHGLGNYVTINADFLSEELPTVKSDPTPILQMIPYQDGILAKLLVRPFKNTGPYFNPGEGRKNLNTNIENIKTQTTRNLSQEIKLTNQAINDISNIDIDDSSEEMYFEEPENCLHLLNELRLYSGKLNLEWPKGEKLKIVNSLDFANFNLDIKNTSNWFEINAEIKTDRKKVIKLKELLDKSKDSKKEFIKIDEGQYIALSKQLKKKIDLLNHSIIEEDDKIFINPLLTNTVQDFEDSGAKLKTDKAWKENRKLIDEVKAYNPQIPKTLQAELRPYQKEGYEWMMRLAKIGLGACLADDMGLGKTVQSIAMLIERAPLGASIVVAPSSVCSNWVNEIKKFAPSLNPVMLGLKNRKKTIEKLGEFDVLIISYGIVQTEIDKLSEKKWNNIVLDEAHAIKNINTKRTKSINKLNGDFKLIATGTPIQNNLEELWSLFNFINPGLLFSQKQFSDRFISNSEQTGSQKHLKNIIKPYILRRNKTQVLDDLPEKTEITISVEMSEDEIAFYEALREKAIENMADSDDKNKTNQMRVLAEITKLRQACCNPAIIDKNWALESSKLKTFERTMDDLLKNNHKCLVFSQFTSHLAIIENLLKEKNISYQYLDGSTPIKTREKRVKAFQSGEGEVFLISLKAGGLGLNLTAADYVIHMDPWWNPAIEDQASDRAHRIGQNRPVTIYRLVSKNTIEEKIVNLHHSKRDLADNLLSGTDTSGKLNIDDMIKLLKGETI